MHPSLARPIRRSVVALCVLASLSTACTPTAGTSPTVDATPTATVVPVATPAVTAAPVGVPAMLAPTTTPIAGSDMCDATKLTAKITSWGGGKSPRVATVEITYGGAETCALATVATPQLVDGHSNIWMHGEAPPPPFATFIVLPGDVFRAAVAADNYCGPRDAMFPFPPVSVAFVLAISGGRVVATPLSPTDLSGLPACWRGPGTLGTMDMELFAP